MKVICAARTEKGSEGSCCLEKWKELGRGEERFSTASPHIARAVLRVIPPLNLLQGHGSAYTGFCSVQSSLCQYSGTAESCVPMLT